MKATKRSDVKCILTMKPEECSTFMDALHRMLTDSEMPVAHRKVLRDIYDALWCAQEEQ